MLSRGTYFDLNTGNNVYVFGVVSKVDTDNGKKVPYAYYNNGGEKCIMELSEFNKRYKMI